MSENSTTAVGARLRACRLLIGISQSKLARLAGVSRFKICTCEIGGGSLSAQEQARIQDALLTEAERLKDLTEVVELSGACLVDNGSSDEGTAGPELQ